MTKLLEALNIILKHGPTHKRNNKHNQTKTGQQKRTNKNEPKTRTNKHGPKNEPKTRTNKTN